MTKEITFTPTKPRSMNRVLSDIEYLIINDVKSETVEANIDQLMHQLKHLKGSLNDRSMSYKLINPTIKYYE